MEKQDKKMYVPTHLGIMHGSSPLLRERAHEVDITGQDGKFTIPDDVKRLSDAMIQVMRRNGGVGIAAPQVGFQCRMISIRSEDGYLTLINPVVTPLSSEMVDSAEACLSIPGVRAKVKRNEMVRVEGVNIHGDHVVMDEVSGLYATVFQHEADHLNGILFIDRMNEFYMNLNKNKLRGLKITALPERVNGFA